MGKPTMVLNGVAYVEMPAPDNWAMPDGVCAFCALYRRPECPGGALDGAARATFGGDCDERDVVYVRTARTGDAP